MPLYLVRRVIVLVPILMLMSLVAFFLIELPPGDYVSFRIQQLRLSGIDVSEDEAARLMMQFGLDKPPLARYWRWITGIVFEGNFGFSLQWMRPVSEILKERIPMTIAISLGALIVSWLVAVPIGIYSATHQYSPLDYLVTFLGFIGLALPGFLVALILAWVLFSKFGFSALGLQSKEFLEVTTWSWARSVDLLKHIWMPLLLVGMGNTSSTIRVVRNNLLDELHKQYVVTARAKGLSEWKLLLKYPVRMAINPLLSTLSWVLPGLVSGTVLIDIVLNLQTVGPVLLRAVLAQDMVLAGSIVLVLSALTVVGALVGDIALVVVDPRIRFGRVQK